MNLSYKEIRTYSPMGRWNSRSVADWLCMPLSPFFSTKFVKWQLRPNTITLFMIFFGIVGSLFFALTKWEFKVLGIICYYLWYIMDCSDGEVARITKQFSTYGRDMDYWAHLTCHPLMNLALWYSYWQLDRYHEWLLAFIFIVFISMEFHRNWKCWQPFCASIHFPTNVSISKFHFIISICLFIRISHRISHVLFTCRVVLIFCCRSRTSFIENDCILL